MLNAADKKPQAPGRFTTGQIRDRVRSIHRPPTPRRIFLSLIAGTVLSPCALPMIRPLIVSTLFAFVVRLSPAAPAIAVLPNADDLAFFEGKVRPLLIERCYECHSDKKQKGGLRLDSQPGWQAGGDTGAVIVPGDPAKSLLVAAISRKNEDLQMPPKEALSAAEVAILANKAGREPGPNNWQRLGRAGGAGCRRKDKGASQGCFKDLRLGDI